MAKQVEYPADTVDANGKVWKTVGENIRHGAKDITTILNDFLYETLNSLFPVGYIYIGELPELLKTKFRWVPGLPQNAVNDMMRFTVPRDLNAVPSYNSSYTVPILDSSEKEKFETVTGITLRKGIWDIPIYHRAM